MGLFSRTPNLGQRPQMNGFNFTERTRAVLAGARDEAVALGHEYVGTEHILLALVAQRDGVSAAVLENLGASPDAIRGQVLAIVRRGGPEGTTGPDLPYTSRAKKALELAMAESRGLDHGYVGTEHLLLGLLGEETGIAAQVLVAAGVTLEAARAETLRLLGSPALDPGPERRPAPAAVRRLPAREAEAWQRLTHALDVTARLGGTPTLTLEDDGSLAVSLGPDLLVSVTLPSDARVRRRGEAGSGRRGESPGAA